MKKIGEWFKQPMNCGMFVGILVLIVPYMSEKFKVGYLMFLGIGLLEEIIRYIILGRPIIQIVVMIECLVALIPVIILSKIDTYFVKLSQYKLYLKNISTVAFVVFYITLMGHLYINKPEARKFIKIMHIIMIFLICFTVIMIFIAKNS